ncbi:hypothetical protein BJX61DRAFT_490993 [Aspergillus egyptiacus]|nr:hypothetical protein BJX61DRAFT_490993 [Aspergillus egyptiacus]
MAGNPHTRTEPLPRSEYDDGGIYTSDAYDEEEETRQSQPELQSQSHQSLSRPTATAETRQRRNRRRKKHLPTETEDVAADSTVQAYNAVGAPQISSINGPIRKQEAAVEQQQVLAQPMEKDEDTGLKLRLELNLDIEVELKARIHGDLTLALLS